jgi:N utilization substance protein A
MASITFNGDTLRQMSLFQDLTGTTAIDCLASDEKIILVVREGDIGKAVGKKGENINRLKRLLRKEVQVVEYSPDPIVFIKNVFRNYGVREVTLQEKNGRVHAVVSVSPAKKGRAIGREGRNLRLARELVSRHHNVQSLVIA